MDTADNPPEDGEDTGELQQPPEVIKWIGEFRAFAQKTAMSRRGQKRSTRKVTQKEKAEALGVDETNYSRWRRGKVIPGDRTLRAILLYVRADSRTRDNLLHLRQAADIARRAARDARCKLPSVPDSSPTPDNDDLAGHDPVAEPPQQQEVIDSILREAGAESHGNPEQERGPGMPATTTQKQDTGELPPSNDNIRPARLPQRLVKAADALADHLVNEWEGAAAARGLDIPPPLPIRWRRSQRSVAGADHLAVEPNHWSRFPPAPGTPPATAEAVQAGDLNDLFEIFSRLGSGRIVLLGDPGSGKTGTATVMLLSALRRREALSDDQRAQTPVPVLLTAHGWDPRSQTLSAWFTAQLASRYDFLRADRYGSNAADELVRNGTVALFLDGFDEMEPELQQIALECIGLQPRTFRLVVLARTDEFEKATHIRPLPGAVALELAPITPTDAVEYLRSHQHDPIRPGDALQPLIDHLQQTPESPIAQALNSPLVLTLVRDDPQAIKQLLQPDRFHTPQEATDHLLERVVPLAWGPDQPPGPSPQQADRWLTYLATQMKTHHSDLAWWQMHHWTSPDGWRWMKARWRVLANTLIGIVVMGGVGALLFGPVGRYIMDGHTGTLFGILYGAAMGAVFGGAAGLVSELRDPSPRHSSPVWSAIRRTSDHLNPAIALFVGTAVAMAVSNQSSPLFGVPAGILAGYFGGRAAQNVRLTTHASPSRREMLRPSGADILAALLAGVPIGLAYGTTKNTPHGLIAAAVTTFVFGLMIMMSRRITGPNISNDPATAWRRDLYRGLRVGLVAGVPLALALGIKNGSAHGLLAGITATIALIVIITAGCMVGLCDSWKTTLLFGQLRLHRAFPLRGMRFLNNARTRRILRAAGPHLQFKHARVQGILADQNQRPSKNSQT
jgi:transcriptional regulator with XRE-family HTH domain